VRSTPSMGGMCSLFISVFEVVRWPWCKMQKCKGSLKVVMTFPYFSNIID
jgi:hypothetical protein